MGTVYGTTIKNLVAIVNIIDRLGEYFSDQAKINLKQITTLKNGLEKQHKDFLVNAKNQIDTFIEKLEKLRSLSGFQFNDIEKIEQELCSYKLDFKYLDKLNSEKTQKVIKPINQSIDKLMKKAGNLKGQIAQQRSKIKDIIKEHENDINRFLSNAGYNYKVTISGEGDEAKLKLIHVDHSQHLNSENQHLSFGERNAFALVLFMYECLRKSPDLIILDDPISSFDKNKKYAILEMLFRRDSDKCLKSKTVLMLTHDMEPVIDTIKILSRQFHDQAFASFLKLNQCIIQEYPIKKEDIQSFAEICKKALASDKSNILKLIYLRRHFEIIDERGDAYQVLSNLFKKRSQPTDTRELQSPSGEFAQMKDDKFSSGCGQIKEDIPDFEYPTMLAQFNDIEKLKLLYQSCTNGYEKLQVFRLINPNIDNPIIQKFINETYHIENEFVCQLDPAEFDTIPEYVTNRCDTFILGLEMELV